MKALETRTVVVHEGRVIMLASPGDVCDLLDATGRPCKLPAVVAVYGVAAGRLRSCVTCLAERGVFPPLAEVRAAIEAAEKPS